MRAMRLAERTSVGARSAGLRGLQEALRSLEQRGVATRKGRCLPSSRREAAQEANRIYGASRLDARRIGEWLGDPGRAPRDPDQVWALVQVWAAWAGEGRGSQQRRYWNQLVEEAQPSPRGADRGDVSSFGGLTDPDRQLVAAAIGDKILKDWMDKVLVKDSPPDNVSSQVPVPAAPPEDSAQVDVSRNIFLVSGRDSAASQVFSSMLQEMGLRLLNYEILVNASEGMSPSPISALRRAPEIAQAALVLLTPDDVVQLHPQLKHPDDPDSEGSPACQPRPNVILELGMLLMAFAEHTIVVEAGALRPISDLAGINVIRFDGSPIAIEKLINRLRMAGCTVDNSAALFDRASFGGLAAYKRRPLM